MADPGPSAAIMQIAAEWRSKLYAGEATADDWAKFTEWMEVAPEHVIAYDLISENEQAFVAVLKQTPELEDKQEPRTGISWQPWAMAASLALVLVASLTLVPNIAGPDAEPVRFATAPAELREIAIAPGLDATLNGETELIQASGTSSEFELVEGEAVFAIGPEHTNGIQVSVGPLVVIDRGTVFNVSTGPGIYRVSVAEGAVDVMIEQQRYEVRAGQLATFESEGRRLTRQPIDPDHVGTWRSRRLEYASAGVEQVLLDASRSLGVRISRGTCNPQAEFAGSIHLAGTVEEDVELIAALLGCSPRPTQEGWTLDA